ncbi:GHKL domain-containing protein [Lachnospiraceae bacterium 45-W7]
MPENIDMMYRMVLNANFLANQLIAAICLLILCRDFIKRKRGTALIGSVYFFVVVILYYVPFLVDGFAAYSLALAAAFVVFVWLDRRNIKMKIFLFVTFFVIRWTVSSTSGKIRSLLSLAVLNIVSGFFDLSDPAMWRFNFIEVVLSTLLGDAFCGVVLYLLVWKINKMLLYKQENLEWRELLLMIIPSANGMVVYGIFRFYADAYEKEMGISFFQPHIPLDLLWIFCYAVILAVIVSTMTLYQYIRKKREEENRGVMLESQIRDMQAHITEVERLYNGIRGVRHDIKNHIEIIDSLIAQGKADEVKEYSKTLAETVETFDFAIKTGNPVTDVILHEKMETALENGIQFDVDFHYPTDMGVNAFDVSVILSNALSNAIEAARAGGFVKVSSFRNKNAYLITVENSFDGRLEIDEESGLPKTKKSDKKTHGFGLQNIKSVAAKYYGDVLIEQKENKVSLTVMLLSAV